MTPEEELAFVNTCFTFPPEQGGNVENYKRLANHFAAECKRLQTEIDFLDSKLASDSSWLDDEALVDVLVIALARYEQNLQFDYGTNQQLQAKTALSAIRKHLTSEDK